MNKDKFAMIELAKLLYDNGKISEDTLWKIIEQVNKPEFRKETVHPPYAENKTK